MSNTLMSIELMTCIAAINLVPVEARAQERPDCPGKIICPLTGELVCKDRCPLGETEAALTRGCCAADAPEVAPGMVSQQDQERPISLRDTLEPLIDHFNSGQGKARFVALLSSTCPACVFGAEAVRDSVLNAYPDADIQLSIVWIDMLPSDNAEAATKSSAIFDDPRVKQFHDPDRKSGYAIAKDLLYENAGPAWDIYLYYDKDAQWTDAPPKPIEWVHQLSGGRRADAARFTPGQKLVESLHSATGRVQPNSPVAAVTPTKTQQPAAVQSDTTPTGRVLRIEGMDCQLCANAVQSALGKLDGVTEVGVDFQRGLGWVGFDSPDAVNDTVLVEAITTAGYAGSIVENAMIQTGTSDKSSPAGGIGVEMEVRTVDELNAVENPPQKLVTLQESLQTLKEKFNTNQDKPRIVALLSPTCGGCVHAARALQKEIIEQYPDEDLSLLIVWEPMLGSDDQPSAEESSNIFNDPRVTQYWDGQRLSGNAYSTQVYPDRFRQVSQVIPEDHFLAAMFKQMADRSPEQIPMWDFALFYPAGVTWKDVPPKAQGFIRQLAYSPMQNGSGSTLLVDDFSKPPIQSDWFDEVRREMRSLMSEDVTDVQPIGVDSDVNLQYLSFPSCPNTPELRERLTAALAELGIDLPIVEVNLMDLEKDDPRLCYGAPTILINGSDLLGQDPAGRPGLQCRIYADGELPSLNELLRRLRSCCSVGDDR